MSSFAVKSPLPFARAWNSGWAALPAHSRSTNTEINFMPPVSNPWTSSPLAFTKSMKPAIFSLLPASMSKESHRSSTANSSAPSFAPPNPRAAATSSALPAALENQDAIALQRSISLHRQFRPFHHGRSHPQPERQTQFRRLQRRQLSRRPRQSARLEATRLPTSNLSSKSWDEFARPGAPPMNFVFTVCDNAAREVCPVWPGQPITAHCGVPDPAAVAGSAAQIERAFLDAFVVLDRRIG